MLNFFRLQSGSLKNDFLSGVTVSLALVPEAIAFAFVAGVSPLIGLYSAFFIGLITALFGGRPGMISGATGAMAVVVVSLVSMHGIEYLFPTVILCGLLQIAIGLGRLGKLIRMVPHPVMLGFVNGLAIVIGLAQVNSFQTIKDGKLGFVQGTQLWLMLGLVGLTMAIIWLLPKLTRAVPASLVAILSVTLIAFVMNSDAPSEMNVVATVGDMLKTNSIAASHATPEATAKNNTVTQNEGAPAQQPEQRLSQSEGADTPVKTSGISGGLPQLFFFRVLNGAAQLEDFVYHLSICNRLMWCWPD
jgi:SulP family sulfate permease